MKTENVVFLSLAALTATGCYRDVNLTLTNPMTYPQSATVQEYDSDRAPTGALISIAPVSGSSSSGPGTMQYPLSSIRVGHDLNVVAQSGGQERFTVIKGPGAQQVTVPLAPQGGLFTNEQSARSLIQAFSALGPPTGFPPTDLENAKNLVGAVKCYVPPTDSNPYPNVVWSRPPGVFSDVVPWPNPYVYPSRSISSEAKVTADAAISGAVSIPVYGSLKAQFSSGDVDEYTIRYGNFGPRDKPEVAATFNPQEALNRLDVSTRKSLLEVMKVPSIVCTYFNHFVVGETIYMNVVHGKKITSSADINAATIVTVNGSYNFDSSNTDNALLTGNVLNLWGDNFLVAQDPSSPADNPTLLWKPYTAPVVQSGTAAVTNPHP